MTRIYLALAALLSGLVFTPGATAADPAYPRDPDAMNPDQLQAYEMPSPDMDLPRFMPPPPGAFSQFPTAEELARMVPREPVTEDTIKKRFAARKQKLKKVLDQDRKAAVKYAQDFSRYQKQQADNLVRLMARAEKRRAAIFNRLEEQENQVLERFRQQQQESIEPAEPSEPAPQVTQ